MKKAGLLFLILPLLFFVSCDKDDDDDVSERFRLLTSPVWILEELLVNGIEPTEGFLANFRGETDFREDGTGSFGELSGTWEFRQNETQIRITTPAFPVPIPANIVELTASSLIISALVPNPENLQETLDIRMTFRAK
jgi:hypothetical protein